MSLLQHQKSKLPVKAGISRLNQTLTQVLYPLENTLNTQNRSSLEINSLLSKSSSAAFWN
jgi:hypothetical protein